MSRWLAHSCAAGSLSCTSVWPCWGWPASVLRYQALKSPPVLVFTTLLPQSRSGEQRPCCSHCVSRRVSLACARGRGWATHGLLTEVSTGVPWVLTGTHPCDAPPRKGGGTSERQLVLYWSVCCGATYTVCGLCRRYVLYCVLLNSSYENSCSTSSGGQGMGKLGENFGVELDQSHKVRSDRWSKDVGRKSSFCIINGNMSSENCWIRGKAPKIQRSSCTPWWYCKRWFWILRSFHWTRIFSISTDSS